MTNTRWTTLHQQKDQTVQDYINALHILWTKLGIKDSDKHIVLKYIAGYIGSTQHKQLLDTFSLQAAYCYAIKI